MNEVVFTDDEYKEILDRLKGMMGEAEVIPYPNAKELIFSILTYFDSVHREPLSRLMKLLDKNYPNLKKDIEADFSLNTMLGLYDLVEDIKIEETKSETIPGFVPVGEVGLLQPIKQKEWLELGNISEFEEYKTYPKNFEHVNFLISKVNTQVYAVENKCTDSILPIDSGKLEEHFLICPWHGCRYDLKTGIAANEPQKQLETYAVEIEKDGLLKVEISY